MFQGINQSCFRCGLVVTLICLAPMTAVAFAPLGHWDFQAEQGDVVPDVSGHGFNGQLRGAAAIVAEGQNSVLALDGIKSCLQIAHHSNLNLTDQVTVALWFKVDQFDVGWQALVTKGDSSWRIHRNRNTRYLNAACGDTPSYRSFAGQTPVDDGQWHQAALVNDGLVMCLYLDGTLEASAPVIQAVPIASNLFPIQVGGNAEKLGRSFKGRIDEVVLYDRALGPEAIASLYTGGVSAVAEMNYSSEEETFYSQVRQMNGLIAQGGASKASDVISLYQNLLQTNPVRAGLAGVMLKVGWAYEQLNQPAAALSLYQEILGQSVSGEMAFEANRRIYSLAVEKDLLPVDAIFDNWLQSSAGNALLRESTYDFIEKQADQFIERKQKQNALALYERVVNGWPNTSESCWALGEMIPLYLAGGELPQADQTIETLLAAECRDPGRLANLLEKLADLLADDYGRPEKALILLQTIIDRWPDEGFALEAYQDMASLHINQENSQLVEATIDLIKQKYAFHPLYSATMTKLGNDYKAAHRMDSAMQLYRLAAASPQKMKSAVVAQRYIAQQEIEEGRYGEMTRLLENFAGHPSLMGQMYSLGYHFERRDYNIPAAINVFNAMADHCTDGKRTIDAFRRIIRMQARTGQDEQLGQTVDRLIAALPRIGLENTGAVWTMTSEDLFWRFDKPGESERINQALLDQWPSGPVAAMARHGLARVALGRADYATADSIISGLLENDPNNPGLPKALCGMGDDYDHYDRPDKAMEMYQHVVANWPTASESVEAQKGMARITLRLQQAADNPLFQATTLLDQYQDNPALAELLLWYGDFMKEAGEYDKALPFYESAAGQARQDDTALRAYTQLAVLYIRAGQSDQVRPILEAIACHFADVAGWQQAIGRIEEAYQQYGHAADIQEIYETVFATCPLDDQALWAKSRSVGLRLRYYQTEQVPEEFASLMSAFVDSPHLPDQIITLGEEAASSRQYDQALDFYQCVLDHFSNDPRVVDAWKGKLLSLASLADISALDDAIGVLLQGPVPPQKPAGILDEVAVACMQRHDDALARELYQRIVAEFPEQTSDVMHAREKLAILDIQLHKDETAETIISRITAFQVEDQQLPARLDRLGRTFLNQDRPDQARVLFLYVLGRWPANEQALWAQQGLAQAAMVTGPPEIFLAMLTRISETYREHPSVTAALMQLADAGEQTGKINAARQVYQVISQAWPEHGDAVTADLRLAVLEMVHDKESAGQAALVTAIEQHQELADLPERLVRFLERRFRQPHDRREAAALLQLSDLIIERFLPKKPGRWHDDIYVYKSYCLYELRRYQETLDFCEGILAEQPQFLYPSFLEILAADCYRTLLTRQPDSEATSERAQRMEAYYQRVLDSYRGPDRHRDVTRSRAAQKLALYYYDQQQWDRAARYMELALQKDDQTSQCNLLGKLADTYDHLGQFNRAATLRQMIAE